MTRQHQSKYYSSEGLRGFQRQIDELWKHIERLEGALPEDEKPPDPRVAAVTLTT